MVTRDVPSLSKINPTPFGLVEFEFEWRFYALSATKAIFRARTYSHNLFSPVMMVT